MVGAITCVLDDGAMAYVSFVLFKLWAERCSFDY